MTTPTNSAHQVAYEGPATFVGPDRQHKSAGFRIIPGQTLPAGTRLRMLIGWFRSLMDNNPQREDQWRNFQVRVEGGGEARAVQQPPHSFHAFAKARTAVERPGHFIVGLAEVTQPIPAGAHITLRCEALLSHQCPIDGQLVPQIGDPGQDTFHDLAEPVALQGIPGETVGLEARLKSAPDESGRFALCVHGVDSVWNPAEPVVEPPEMETEVLGPGSLQGGALSVESEGPVRVRVRARHRGFEARTNPVLRDPINGRRVYFGGIHWHSRHADGDRPLPQAYEYARDVLGLDFAGVTDHTPIPIWDQTCQTNEHFNQPGRFVTLPAWEWSTQTGHSNVYLRSPDVPAGPEHARSADHPGNADWPDDAIVVPHHTNIRAAELKDDGTPYWFEFNWHLRNQRVRLVELVQTRGNFEADQCDADWGIVTGGIGASVQDALAMGYRIGFVGGTDNHAGFPTRAPALEQAFVGMACVLAEDLTRESIWQAMDARRTYATSGKPILAHWRVNGHELGQEATLTNDRVTFAARLHGTAPIERVEVISAGQVVWRTHPDAYDVILEDETLPSPRGQSAYYYLRLRQHDGHRAWLSPVWLDRA